MKSIALPPPSSLLRPWRHLLLPVLAAGLLAACGGGDMEPTPQELADICRSQVNDTPQKLLPCVTPEAVQAHLRAFADIAAANGGDREAGTAGDAATLRYLEEKLRAAGYAVTVQPVAFRGFQPLAPSVLEERSPGIGPLEHDMLQFSGSGDVTAAVAMPSVATGCQPADFAAFPRGSIALVRRGDCSFHDKATHAAQAGAAAVLIFNHEEGPLAGDLGQQFAPDLPVLGLTRTAGEALAARIPAGLVLHAKAQTERRDIRTSNLVAESATGDPSNVVMAGAHLDSVAGTAGINDNGSGTAVLLETALQMARVPTKQRVRFAFWAAEEHGLVGSTHYVENLSAAEIARIALYLNFDMVASPNYGFVLFTGDGTPPEGTAARPAAGALIQKVLAGFYEARGLAWETTDAADGRSDHAPFGDAGIPYGGLFTGAETTKTAAQATLWGGTAGQAFDPCYHQACDNLGNVNTFALATNADAVAAAVLHFAMNGLPR